MTIDTDLIDGFLQDAEGAIARSAMKQAKVLYQGVLRVDETNITALTQLGALAFADADFHQALVFYGLAIEQENRDPDIHHALAAVYWKLGQTDKAERAFDTALRIEPNHEPALMDKARLLQSLGRLDESEQLYLQLTSKNTSRVDAIFNRGVVMFRKGNLVAAERWFRQAARLDPNGSRPMINLALIYRYWGRYEAARTLLTQVIERDPDQVDAHWNLANLDLLLGNLKDGFVRKEWRFKRAGFLPPRRDLPMWDGSSDTGKGLLLVVEQGFGDTIQMVRFAKTLSDQGHRVGIEAQPTLHGLLSTVPGISDVLAPGEPSNEYSYWLPIMSLPAALGIEENTIPRAVPYVSVPVKTPRPHLGGAGIKVGLVWRGNPKHETDHLRSIPLSFWGEILKIPGVDFYSLQVGTDGTELQAAQKKYNITDVAPELTDFSATAAWVNQLDYVITVDTAMAHLAGAMKKPVWLLVSPANDWRWMKGRHDSPWYRTLHIFRAARIGRWHDLISKVARILEQRV
ncbi:MAG: tetratricopeptide repeat-containing glycosyltransferase family protein [Rhodospirillaceae bacterium]